MELSNCHPKFAHSSYVNFAYSKFLTFQPDKTGLDLNPGELTVGKATEAAFLIDSSPLEVLGSELAVFADFFVTEILLKYVLSACVVILSLYGASIHMLLECLSVGFRIVDAFHYNPFNKFLDLRPIHIIRARTTRNPGSNNSGTSLCPGEIHPLSIGIGLGRTPKLSDSQFADSA